MIYKIKYGLDYQIYDELGPEVSDDTRWTEEDVRTDAQNFEMTVEEFIDRYLEEANEVRALRQKLGVSQQKFADQYHIPKRTIENWEGGKSVPPSYVIELLRRAVEEDMQK